MQLYRDNLVRLLKMDLADTLASIDAVSLKGDDKLIMYGTDALGQRVVAKSVVYSYDPSATSAYSNREEYEAAVYERVVGPMRDAGECDNLVALVAWVAAQPVQEWLEGLQRVPGGAAERLRGFADQHAGDAVSTLVTATPDGFRDTLTSELAAQPGLLDDWRVPFQMAYTLTACELAGLTHNDNHLDNWLVSYDAPTVYYAVAADAVVPVGGVRVWLFDWDLAYAHALGDNPYLTPELCAAAGVCNDVSGLRDLAHMACALDHAAGRACGPGPGFMWRSVRDAVCGRQSRHPCHLPRTLLTAPPAATALGYVLQIPAVAAQVIPVADLRPDVAARLLGGQEVWVAHRGVDRRALQRGLEAAAAYGETVAVQPPADGPVYNGPSNGNAGGPMDTGPGDGGADGPMDDGPSNGNAGVPVDAWASADPDASVAVSPMNNGTGDGGAGFPNASVAVSPSAADDWMRFLNADVVGVPVNPPAEWA